MANLLDPESSTVLIIGCGTWGSSTALWLARSGYKHVTVLDPYPVPSPISAGNDVNKIVEGRSRKPFESYSGPKAEFEWTGNEVRADATDAWANDPLFREFYHETGYIISASRPETIKELYDDEQPTVENGFTEVNTAAQFRSLMPEGVLTGDFPGWKGWYKARGAGWVHARKALIAATTEAQRIGVKLVTAEVTRLIFEGGDVKGAVVADGMSYRADRTLLCAGASAPQLLDLRNQLRPTAWTLAHMKMTIEEVNLYKDLPVLFNVERGFFVEPDVDNHELKICDEHPGYCNWSKSTLDCGRASTPFARHQIPKNSEQGIRQFLQETMPHLADRSFSFARICWCADTPDREFLISKHPDYPSLVLGVGGSGHGFMHIPVIGKYIMQCMEDELEPRMQRTWRWRPETAVGRDWDALQGRWGGPNKVRNLADLGEGEWTEVGARL